MSSESSLVHAPAHRPVPGDFNTTLVTFAAMALCDHFDAGQRLRAVVPLGDANRTHWNFLPESGRRGVALRDMNDVQRYLTHRLIAQCLSVSGYAQVVQVMSLEHVLRELNAPVFGHVAAHFRDPEGYFLTFFDQPQPDSDWGWRLVGHHLSLNFTVAGQDLIAATPLLLGAEPGRLGPFRILGHEEDLGFAVLKCLDGAQAATATIHPTPPPDFASRCVPVLGDEEWPDVHGVGRRDAGITDVDRKALRWVRGTPRGLARARMGAGQQQAFDHLVEAFVARLKPEQAGREMDRIRSAGHDDLHFVWAGSHRPDEPHYFRVEGPVTLIEFDNTEDGANHVHCVWRDPANDFGADILARHRAAQHESVELS
ncbi:DUF3500 domain-containing protein [Cryptosporangium sp. NPDC051539]|uniref:DUF3500 domain-containing protein n=1 Tax=Cryptosporangium sp. NPDC051539 TaxID=3363962 RepID=UPI0037B2EEF2